MREGDKAKTLLNSTFESTNGSAI